MIAVLLSITALIAYTMGSLRTDIIASRFFLHKNLQAYSRDNLGITRFLNDFGRMGVVIVVLTEALKTVIPVLLGGLLLSIRGQGDMGRAFALFCVMMGTTFPVLYGFKGEHSLIAMCAGLICVNFSVGVLAAAMFIGMYFLTRYISLAALISALFTLMVTIILLEGDWVHRLLLGCIVIVFIEYRKNIVRLIRKKEPKFIYRKDLSYIFDESV